MTVKTLKSHQGDYIVAKVEKEDDKFVYVTKPTMIAVTETGMTLVPYHTFSKDNKSLPFLKDGFQFVLESDKTLTEAYTKLTSSILTPGGKQGGLIVP